MVHLERTLKVYHLWCLGDGLLQPSSQSTNRHRCSKDHDDSQQTPEERSCVRHEGGPESGRCPPADQRQHAENDSEEVGEDSEASSSVGAVVPLGEGGIQPIQGCCEGRKGCEQHDPDANGEAADAKHADGFHYDLRSEVRFRRTSFECGKIIKDYTIEMV